MEAIIANNRDVVLAAPGRAVPEDIRHIRLPGLVDTGAARLVLPEWVADELELNDLGKSRVRYADQRTGERRKLGYVWLKLLGREGLFSAILEPGRETALLGAIVLEELDLVVDPIAQTLHPRDPDWIITEIE